MKKILYLTSGVFILLVLAVSYFINVNAEEGGNYVIQTPLLGILIFHNPLILTLYIIIVVYLIIRGIWKIKLE